MSSSPLSFVVRALPLAPSLSGYSRRDDPYLQMLSIGDAVPYTREEGELLIPGILTGDPFVSGMKEGVAVVRMLPSSGYYHGFIFPLEVEMDYFGLVCSNAAVAYMIRGSVDNFFAYDPYPTDVLWNPITPHYRHEKFLNLTHVPGTLVFDGVSFIPGNMAQGPWWTTSLDGNFVTAWLSYEAEEEDRLHVVFSARKFVSLFVPWWRGGPLYFGPPDAHVVPFLPQEFHGVDTADLGIHVDHIPLPNIRNGASILGYRDEFGALPLLRVPGTGDQMTSFRRSHVLVVAYASAPRAYDVRYTDFDCSVIPPANPIFLPLELALKVNAMASSKGTLNPALRIVTCIPPNREILPCGCSAFSSCSATDTLVVNDRLNVLSFHNEAGFLSEHKNVNAFIQIHMFPTPFALFSGELTDISPTFSVKHWNGQALAPEGEESYGRILHCARLANALANDNPEMDVEFYNLPADDGRPILVDPIQVVFEDAPRRIPVRSFSIVFSHEEKWEKIRQRFGVKMLRHGEDLTY